MYNAPEIEKKVLEFWSENTIFNKRRIKNKGKKRFSFLDGPITANNPMGVHHAWGRTYKDLYLRFKAMQGFDQRYQNGFDCQGLWVEREEEKDLGLKSKADIERFGILKFVQACKARVEKFSKIQTQQSIRLGMWMDWSNSYYTMTDNNNLHNWFLLKTYFDNGWLYKGKDAVPWCWRCGTASSKHDIATEGYKEITHSALFMQFPLKHKVNEYFLIFTTTPWTIPANVAIAVNRDLDYVKVKNDGSYYWLAESRLCELEGDYGVVEKRKGKDLNGWQYDMPYRDIEAQKNAPHKVVLWELASGSEGTGIVHIAPGCGAEDFDLGKTEGLPVISPLDEAGVFMEGFGEFSLRKYSDVGKSVLEDLDQTRHVYKIVPYKHRYPHCWRCGEELVFRSVDEWYVKCDEIRSQLIKENKKVKWFPEYGKLRQEDWFKNMGDWLISRKRYWGLPLPIWECSCGHIEVFGSLGELKKQAIDKKLVDNLPELHRPYIDEIKIKCKKCKKEISRVKDVGDAWLDAGIVPLSTMGPYLTNNIEWTKWFPADFICENMPGQYRGWFNALFWASVTLTGKTPFKSILGYETLKDEKGEEMHKSKGNAIWFDDAVEKIGADSMRLLYMLQDPTQELRFGFNVVKEPKNNINILFNLGNLLVGCRKGKFKKAEDKWIISKLNSLIANVTTEIEDLHPHLATRAVQEFWLNDFSRGYIQMVRDRISINDEDVNFVMKEVYLTLLKLCAPIIPFVTEAVWQNLRSKIDLDEESVHLCDWPRSNVKLINKKLEKSFEVVNTVVPAILCVRAREGINVRWPLRSCVIYLNKKCDIFTKDVLDVIKRQTNVKEIKVEVSKKSVDDLALDSFKFGAVKVDTRMNKKLEEEGYARELSRKIQDERKVLGLKKSDLVELVVESDLKLSKTFIEELKIKCGVKDLDFGKAPKNFEKNTEFRIRDKNFKLYFTKFYIK
jgi:isoleucyl-tRNA synthetase